MNFTDNVVLWYHKNRRDLPWRNTTDPYIIWLSEIILQQTRVDQGMPYFYRFAEAYPSVTHFAAATEDVECVVGRVARVDVHLVRDRQLAAGLDEQRVVVAARVERDEVVGRRVQRRRLRQRARDRARPGRVRRSTDRLDRPDLGRRYRHGRRHSSGPTQRVFLAVRRQGIRGVSPVNEKVEPC